MGFVILLMADNWELGGGCSGSRSAGGREFAPTEGEEAAQDVH